MGKCPCYYGINNIGDSITQSLVKDYGISEEKAVDMYFDSEIYQQLIDEATGLYQKSWEFVYEMLKQKIKIYRRLP